MIDITYLLTFKAGKTKSLIHVDNIRVSTSLMNQRQLTEFQNVKTMADTRDCHDQTRVRKATGIMILISLTQVSEYYLFNRKLILHQLY